MSSKFFAIEKPVPCLSFNVVDRRWELSSIIRMSGVYTTYICQIDNSWDGECWYRFKFFFQDDQGRRFELLTKTEFEERVQLIKECDGIAASLAWINSQTEVEVVRDCHPVFSMREHWLAMMTLRLFTPAVTT